MAATYAILSTGLSQVPLGGQAVANVLVKRNGTPDDPSTLQAVLKDNTGATLSDETFSGTPISTVATDGGAITITDPAGDGTLLWGYVIPNDATYSPPSTGLTFTITFTAIDTDGATDGGTTFSFKVVPASVSVSLDRTTVLATVKRRAGLLTDVLRVTHDATKVPEDASSRDLIDLGDGPIYSLEVAVKNGTTMALTTDYLWSTYRSNIALIAQSANNDHFFFQVQRRMSDTAIEDFIDESERFVLGRLREFYDDVALATYPTVEALIIARTVGYIKEELQDGIALESPKYRSGRELIEETTAALMSICQGAMGIEDDSGNLVARKNGSLAGGTRHADGQINGRIDMLNRAQRWSGIFSDFWPETPALQIGNPRRL